MLAMKKISIVLIASLYSLFLDAQDIKSTVSGFAADIDVVYGEWSTGSFFLGNLAELEPLGGGLRFKAAYGFMERFQIFLAYSTMEYNISGEWDRFINNNFNFGGRIYFGATLRRWRPYLEMGISSNNFLMDPIYIDTNGPFELELRGIGFSPGGGVNYFLTPSFALQANLNFAFGAFNNVEISGETNEFEETLDFTFYHFSLGASYFFQ